MAGLAARKSASQRPHWYKNGIFQFGLSSIVLCREEMGGTGPLVMKQFPVAQTIATESCQLDVQWPGETSLGTGPGS